MKSKKTALTAATISALLGLFLNAPAGSVRFGPINPDGKVIEGQRRPHRPPSWQLQGLSNGKVTRVQLRPLRTSPQKIKCPVHIHLYGWISTDGPAKVKYTWVSSDGRSWPETSLTFGVKATQFVSVSWELGKPGHNVNAWIQLEVLSPNTVESTKTTASFRCK
jgi:hypothetical protein